MKKQFRIYNTIRIISLLSFLSILTACGGGGGGSSSNGSFSNNNSPSATKPDDTLSSSSSSSSSSSLTSSSSSKSSVSTSSISSSLSSALGDTTAPSTPDMFIASTVASDNVTLNWSQAVDNIGTIYYRVYRNQALLDASWAPNSSYVDTSVQPNQSYLYGISAGDGSGNWSPVKSIRVTTPIQSASNSSQASSNSSQASSNSLADTTPPNPPDNFKLDAAFSNHVDMSWNAASDDIGVASYKIYRDSTLLITLSGNQLSYSDTNAQADKHYTYSIKATDAAGNMSSSQLLVAQTPVATVTGAVTLSWQAPTTRVNGALLAVTDLNGYELRYKPQADTTYTIIQLDSSATSYALNNLVGDYDFEIAAIDKNHFYSEFAPLAPH